MSGAGGFPGVSAVSLHPVGLRLHLRQSGDGPLEGKDLLLGREQREALGGLLKRGTEAGVNG